MNSAISKFNLVGVMLLSGLCAMQWGAQRQLAARNERLERERAALEVDKADLVRAMVGAKEDLDQLRVQAADCHHDREAADKRLSAAGSELQDLRFKQEQLNAAEGSWKEAIIGRDAILRQVQQSLAVAIGERNSMIEKYNGLVRSQNDAVRQLNASLEELARLRSSIHTNSGGETAPSAKLK